MIRKANIIQRLFSKWSHVDRRARSGYSVESVIPYQVEMLEERVLLSATNYFAELSDWYNENEDLFQHTALFAHLDGTDDDPNASGGVKYVSFFGQEYLKVKVEDLTSVAADDEVEVFINDASVGIITVREMYDGSLGGYLQLKSLKGDNVPDDLKSGDPVEVRKTDGSDTVIVSGSLDNFYNVWSHHGQWNSLWNKDYSHWDITKLADHLTGTDADPSAEGGVKYVEYNDDQHLKVKIDNVESVAANEEVEVFVDDTSVGKITIQEQWYGSLGGSLELDSADGDVFPPDIESGDEVEVRKTDGSDTVILSGQLDNIYHLWDFSDHQPSLWWWRFFI